MNREETVKAVMNEVVRRAGTDAKLSASFVKAVKDRTQIEFEGNIDFNLYKISDIAEELVDTMINLVAWMVLDVVRYFELYQDEFVKIEDKYWEELLFRMRIVELKRLHDKVQRAIDIEEASESGPKPTRTKCCSTNDGEENEKGRAD